MSNHSRPTGDLARPNHMGGLSGLQIMLRRMGRRGSKHTTRAKSDPGWREKQAPPKGKRSQNQSKPPKKEASASKVEGPSGWPSRSLPSAVYTAYASKKKARSSFGTQERQNRGPLPTGPRQWDFTGSCHWQSARLSAAAATSESTPAGPRAVRIGTPSQAGACR